MTRAKLDVKMLYKAIDGKRRGLGISWRQVAKEAGISASTLTRMGQGRRPDVDSFAALADWLKMSADLFMIGIPLVMAIKGYFDLMQ